MNTPDETTEPRPTRPGYWLRAIEHRKHQLGREQRKAFRDQLADKAREGIPDEDYAITMATLEKMATNLGWDESQRDEVHARGFGHGGHRFGHGFDHGFDHGGFAPRDFGHRGPRREDLPNETPEA